MEDETTETDRSFNEGDLTVSDGDTIPQSEIKKFGTYSRDFESNDGDYLYHADGNATDLSGANVKFTFLLWWRPESVGGPYEYLLSKYGASGTFQYAVHIGDGNDFAYRLSSNGTSSASDRTGNALSNGTWYHVAVVSDDVNARIYQDGVLDNDATSSFTGGLYDGSANFLIGGANNTGFADGLIDDVGMFNTNLDSTDINDIMDNGLVQASSSLLQILNTGIF
jgi:hypothetical protein